MSIFVNESAKHVILSARKCGLMTLSESVTDIFKNKSENIGWNHGNPDPHLLQGNIGRSISEKINNAEKIPKYVKLPIKVATPFDDTTWADYDVTLIIRDPYERYISGARTVWTLQHQSKHNGQRPNLENFEQWYDDEYNKFGLGLYNGHVSHWLHVIDNMQYKTIEVVDTKNLSQWQLDNGFLAHHKHKSHIQDKDIVKAHIDKHYIEELTEYLKPEVERYKKWLTFES